VVWEDGGDGNILASYPIPPAAGSVPHIYTKGATAYYSQAGWSVGGGGVGQAGGCAARRQGVGIGCAPLPGRWGEGRWGAFSESAEGGVDREDSFPIARWAAQWAAKAGKVGRLGYQSPTGETPGRGTRPSG
jgi:hypothetical protein